MKTTYIAPATEVADVELTGLTCASGVTSDSSGIGYGGLDEDGSKEAETRQAFTIFLFD